MTYASTPCKNGFVFMLDKKTTLRLPIDLHKRILIAAAIDYVSMQQKVIQLLEKGLNK